MKGDSGHMMGRPLFFRLGSVKPSGLRCCHCDAFCNLELSVFTIENGCDEGEVMDSEHWLHFTHSETASFIVCVWLEAI